jgi:hypothetical protein
MVCVSSDLPAEEERWDLFPGQWPDLDASCSNLTLRESSSFPTIARGKYSIETDAHHPMQGYSRSGCRVRSDGVVGKDDIGMYREGRGGGGKVMDPKGRARCNKRTQARIGEGPFWVWEQSIGGRGGNP